MDKNGKASDPQRQADEERQKRQAEADFRDKKAQEAEQAREREAQRQKDTAAKDAKDQKTFDQGVKKGEQQPAAELSGKPRVRNMGPAKEEAQPKPEKDQKAAAEPASPRVRNMGPSANEPAKQQGPASPSANQPQNQATAAAGNSSRGHLTPEQRQSMKDQIAGREGPSQERTKQAEQQKGR